MKKTIVALSAIALAVSIQAESVTDWYYTSGGNNSGLDTASPVLGDGTANNADDIKLNGSFTEVSLLDGETITLSGGVTFTGMDGTRRTDQFRFGLFDDLGDADASTWDGYRSANVGAVRLAGTSAENPTTWSGTLIGSTTGFGDIQNDTPYAFSLSLTRNGGGIDIVSTMTDGINTFAEASFNHASADTFDFNTVGLLSGGDINSDQTSFSNIEVTVTVVSTPVGDVVDLMISGPVAGDMELSWTGEDFGTYGVQTNLNLSTTNWGLLMTGIPGTGGTIVTNTPVGPAQMFYRVITE